MARSLLVASMVSALVACGGADPAEDGSDPDVTTGGELSSDVAPAAPELSWSEMDSEQRGAFMADVVAPEMAQLFQEFDGERFADFGCDTCHGSDMRDVGFSMPNGVAPLDPSQIGGMFQSDQPMAVFMTQRVWPRMTELLGHEPFNPETGEGFGCLNCHATAEAAAP